MSDKDVFYELRNNMIGLYEAGNYDVALELVEKIEPKIPDMSARTTFWKMCVLSLQSSGTAIYATMSGSLPLRGFIAGATAWADVESLAAIAAGAKFDQSFTRAFNLFSRSENGYLRITQSL